MKTLALVQCIFELQYEALEFINPTLNQVD